MERIDSEGLGIEFIKEDRHCIPDGFAVVADRRKNASYVTATGRA
jgi:hypothetical protein